MSLLQGVSKLTGKTSAGNRTHLKHKHAPTTASRQTTGQGFNRQC